MSGSRHSSVEPTGEAPGIPPASAENSREARRSPGRRQADKRLLGVWDIPEDLNEMTDDEIDRTAERIADSIMTALESGREE